MPVIEETVAERAAEIKVLVREAMESARREEREYMDTMLREVRQRHEARRRTLPKLLHSMMSAVRRKQPK